MSIHLPTQRYAFVGGPWDGRVYLDTPPNVVPVEGGEYRRAETFTKATEFHPGWWGMDGDAVWRWHPA